MGDRPNDNDINKDFDRAQCSGMMIDEKTLVTASHCLDYITNGSSGRIKDTKNLTETKTIRISVGNEKSPNYVNLAMGASAVFTGPKVETADQRKIFHYEPLASKKRSDPNSKEYKEFRDFQAKLMSVNDEDMAIVKLKEPVKLLPNVRCPRLPRDQEECDALNRKLDARAIDGKLFKAHFSHSENPSETQPLAGEPGHHDFGLHGPVVVAQGPEAPTRLRDSSLVIFKGITTGASAVTTNTGDSGSALLLSSQDGGRDTLIGVQSCTALSDKKPVSVIATVCKNISDPRYAAVVGEAATSPPATAKPAFVEAPTAGSADAK